MKVNRIYVEKKPGFDPDAGSLLKDIRELLNISSVSEVRILNRYDVSGISDEIFELCKTTVFSEPPMDRLYNEIPDADYVLAVEYLPGQFDQRADSCRQCIQFITGGERPPVRTARIYCINGSLKSSELSIIKNHLINPVESREAELGLPDSIELKYQEVPDIEEIRLPSVAADIDELNEFIKSHSLAMDSDDLSVLIEYFEDEGRCPTESELKVIDTYWSDHCRHTTFSTILEDVEINDEKVARGYARYQRIREELGRSGTEDLMDMATIAGKYLKKQGLLESLDESDEINACTVKAEVNVDGAPESWLLLFKNETHNHPTEIEPFGGAATCIGGAIRDPLSGRGYVYQAMRITGAGDPTQPLASTLPGKLPQRTIVRAAAKGYSSYGNQIGLATGLVREIYHSGYIAKRMEVGAVVGAVPEAQVVRERPQKGDIVILLGGRTGRDGCGGATGSSKSHSISSLKECGAEVQKGNAPEERKLQRLFRNPEASRMIKRCNDFGAGGVSVAIGELADGIRIYLDRIPKKYEGLDGTELAISESQERMAVVVGYDNMAAFIAMANEENIEATYVADITDCNRMTMYWRDKAIVDISRDFLNSNGAKRKIKAVVQKAESFSAIHNSHNSFKEAYFALVSDLNVCSQRGLAEHFDSSIGAGTVIFPFGGRMQKTPSDVMAAAFPVQHGSTDTCSMMSYGFNPYISSCSCYDGAYLAVLESVCRLIAAGASMNAMYLSFQEYFERPGTNPKRWGKPVAALIGALEAQLDLKLAAIGGKDSMSGSFEQLDVPPTLISFAVAVLNKADIVSNEFKQAGNAVLLISPDYDGALPTGEALREYLERASKLIKAEHVLTAATPGYGGIAEVIFKSCLGNGLGFETDAAVDYGEMFEYRYGSFIIEVEETCVQRVTEAYPALNIMRLGTIIADYRLKAAKGEADCEIDMAELEKPYYARLESVYPSRIAHNGSCDNSVPKISYRADEGCIYRPGLKLLKPKVLIPVFPGTNCENDTAAAFERAGASPEILLVKNMTAACVQESVEAMAKALKGCNIMMIPGGFSAGDEPDGSAKFITAFFRNPQLKSAIEELTDKRDGLIGGICNGFQALIKLGLLPYGRITEPNEDAPTLAANLISRHQSSLVRTRICSDKSPWLSLNQIDDISMVAISHGEGRFVCNDGLLKTLISCGQIATQYVDDKGEPSMDIDFNPNGSVMAVEGITSADGRIFGKMGHTERMYEGLYKNIPMQGCSELLMFKAAVKYFN